LEFKKICNVLGSVPASFFTWEAWCQQFGFWNWTNWNKGTRLRTMQFKMQPLHQRGCRNWTSF
jgi:hypothetical protein